MMGHTRWRLELLMLSQLAYKLLHPLFQHLDVCNGIHGIVVRASLSCDGTRTASWKSIAASLFAMFASTARGGTASSSARPSLLHSNVKSLAVLHGMYLEAGCHQRHAYRKWVVFDRS